MLSCVLILPASQVAIGNAVGEAMGWGPNSYSVPLSADGAEPATHYGLHSWAGTNFSSWYNQSEGTIVWSGDFATINGNRLVSIDAGVAARTADIYATGPNAVSYYKTSDASQRQIGTGVSVNNVCKVALAIKFNDYNGALNGVLGGADTITGAVAVADRLSLGHWNNGGFLNGHIRTITYFNTRLANTQLQVLTR